MKTVDDAKQHLRITEIRNVKIRTIYMQLYILQLLQIMNNLYFEGILSKEKNELFTNSSNPWNPDCLQNGSELLTSAISICMVSCK